MTTRVIGALTLSIAATLGLTANATAQTVTFENIRPGQIPLGFEMGLTGEGGGGRWQVVDDVSAGHRVLAQLSENPAANRFLVAIYRARAANGEVTTRCKPVSGKTDRACGLIIRASDTQNYYIARSNALESNVRFYRVRNGQRQQLATAENIKIASGQYHTLTMRAEGNTFTVAYNGKPLLTTTDTTTAEPRPSEGRAGLWVKSDSVTYFERLEITKLP